MLYRVEISCDGGNSWEPFGDSTSQEEAIGTKKEIELHVGDMVDLRVVPAEIEPLFLVEITYDRGDHWDVRNDNLTYDEAVSAKESIECHDTSPNVYARVVPMK